MGLVQPGLHNSEGDEVVFHELTFRLAPKASSTLVERRLQQLDSLRRENETYWNWIGGHAPTSAGTDKDLSWNVTLEDGSVVLGAIELKGRTLVLNVNSEARAERGKAMLEEALGGLLGAPLTKIQTDRAVEGGERGQPYPAGARHLARGADRTRPRNARQTVPGASRPACSRPWRRVTPGGGAQCQGAREGGRLAQAA